MLKKIVFGILIGFVLSFSVSVHAEVVNMIGKVVDGTIDLTVNGSKLNTQAIVIEGVSYAPIRVVGDALGMQVNYDATIGASLTSPSTAIKNQIDVLGKQAKDLFDQRRLLSNSSIAPYETPSGKDANGRDIYKEKDETYYIAKKKYDDLTHQLNDISAQIELLSKQL